MFRLILFFFVAVVILILALPYMLFQVVFHFINPMASHKSTQAFVGFVMKIAMVCVGIKWEIEGKENIPKGVPVMYVPNHRSIWDIMLTYPFVGRPTSFISKDTVKKIPLINVWMWLMHDQFLDRHDLKKGAQLILKCVELVKTGYSVTLFAEGTRSRGESETELLEFHEGSFKIASRGGCAIVPVAIHNSFSIWEKQFPKIRPARVKVRFGEPFFIKDLEKEDQKLPGAYTRGVITRMLEEMQDEA